MSLSSFIAQCKDDQGVWANQDAWFHLEILGKSDEYKIKRGR